MDTIPQLKEEAQQLRKRLEILEQAVENVGNCKRLPEPGEIWEHSHRGEYLCLAIKPCKRFPYRMVNISTGETDGWTEHVVFNHATFKRKAQL